MRIKTPILALLLMFIRLACAQDVDDKKADANPIVSEKDKIAFLQEVATDVRALRTLENRISFSSELAGIMWRSDERQASAMFTAVMGDLKELLARYDSQINALGSLESGEDEYDGGFLAEMPKRNAVYRKFQTAMSVRQQIAMNLARLDPDRAYAFFVDSAQLVTNPELRKQLERSDEYFEVQLASGIADGNAGKAAQYGRRSLEKGLSYQHIELLKKIYAKDADAGAEFAQAILGQAKSARVANADYNVLGTLLNFASENYEQSRKDGGKKPAYTQSEITAIAEAWAQAILNNKSPLTSGGYEANMIERYAPGRAAQIRAKYGRGISNSNSVYPSNSNSMVSTVDDMDYGSANRSVPDANTQWRQHKDEKEKTDRRMAEDIARLGDKQLSAEERAKIVAEVRKVIQRTSGTEKKITALSVLAAQVSTAGDKELAAEIMKDAAALVNPQPKNYQDFLLTWMLAGGYAVADPDKAYPLLDDTISRVNDTIEAFVKVGEFIDPEGEMIQDGEVQIGLFGGMMIRGLSSELGIVNATIRPLAKHDFGKLRALTNRFERPEARVMAKMLVLRAISENESEDIAVGK